MDKFTWTIKIKQIHNMIYVLVGNDYKNKNAYVSKISEGTLPVVIEDESLSKEEILSHISPVSLFGEDSIIVLDNINKFDIEFSKSEIESLHHSKNTFVFLEDKILAPALNKFKKFAVIENFRLKEDTPNIKANNNFVIADNFARRNKFGTWLSFKEAISFGASPEEISGILFWKIKMMIISSSNYFSKEELKVIQSNLVGLYHDSHIGKKDFTIGLEQFILSSLEKK